MCFQEMELVELMALLASPLQSTDGLDEATCSPKSPEYAMDSAEASPDSVYQEALASPHEGTNSPAMDLDPNNSDQLEHSCEPAPAKEKGTEKKPAPKVSPKSDRKHNKKKGKNGVAVAKAKPKGKTLKAAGKPKAKPKPKSQPAKKQIRKVKDDVEKKMHSVFWPHPVSQQLNFGSVSLSPKCLSYFHRLTPKVYSGAHKAARVAKMTPEAAKDMAHWECRKRPGKIRCRVTQTVDNSFDPNPKHSQIPL